jgi:hypothetical protein
MTAENTIRYYTVRGYIHPKRGGDDKQFYRGFEIKSTSPGADIQAYLVKMITADLKKTSSVTDDFSIQEVSKEAYLKDFK